MGDLGTVEGQIFISPPLAGVLKSIVLAWNGYSGCVKAVSNKLRR